MFLLTCVLNVAQESTVQLYYELIKTLILSQ